MGRVWVQFFYPFDIWKNIGVCNQTTDSYLDELSPDDATLPPVSCRAPRYQPAVRKLIVTRYVQSRIETVVPFSGNCRPGDQLAGEHPRHHGPLLPQDRRVAVVAAGVDAVGGRDSGGGQV